MARFPIDETTLPALGKALERAVNDETARQAFVGDPRAYLIAAGVDPKALEGHELSVPEETATKLHFVIPAKIDQAKIEAGNADDLAELGKSVTLNCTYMVERRVVPLERRTADEEAKTGTLG